MIEYVRIYLEIVFVEQQQVFVLFFIFLSFIFFFAIFEIEHDTMQNGAIKNINDVVVVVAVRIAVNNLRSRRRIFNTLKHTYFYTV